MSAFVVRGFMHSRLGIFKRQWCIERLSDLKAPTYKILLQPLKRIERVLRGFAILSLDLRMRLYII